MEPGVFVVAVVAAGLADVLDGVHGELRGDGLEARGGQVKPRKEIPIKLTLLDLLAELLRLDRDPPGGELKVVRIGDRRKDGLLLHLVVQNRRLRDALHEESLAPDTAVTSGNGHRLPKLAVADPHEADPHVHRVVRMSLLHVPDELTLGSDVLPARGHLVARHLHMLKAAAAVLVRVLPHGRPGGPEVHPRQRLMRLQIEELYEESLNSVVHTVWSDKTRVDEAVGAEMPEVCGPPLRRGEGRGV